MSFVDVAMAFVFELVYYNIASVKHDVENRGQEKVQVGKDQEKVQSEKDSHSKNLGGKKPN